IMRSVTYVKETAISTVIGIVFALVAAYTIGLHALSIGITVILAIAFNMKMGWVKTVNLSILTIAIIMMSGEETVNFMYLCQRLYLIVIGISSAFIIIELIFPYNYLKFF